MSSAPSPQLAANLEATPQIAGRSTSFTVFACAVFAVLGIVTTLLGPTLPLLARRWSVSIAHAGELFSWQFVSSTLGTLISGLTLAKRSFKLAVLLGLALCLIGIGILIKADWSLGRCGVAAYGFGLGIALPAINLAVAEANETRRAASVSILNFAWTIGAIAGPVILQLTRSLEVFFISLTALLSLSLSGSAVIAMPAKQAEVKDAAGIAPKSKIWALVPFLAFSMFLCCGVENAVAGWASSLALPNFSDAYTATSATIAFWTLFLAGRALVPAVLRSISEQSVLVSSILVAGGGVLLFGFASQTAVILVACALAGLGIGPGIPLIISRISELIGSQHPASMVCFSFAGIGAATLPPLVGILGGRAGHPRAGLMLPFAALISLLTITRTLVPRAGTGYRRL